jgi:hypothetical protein
MEPSNAANTAHDESFYGVFVDTDVEDIGGLNGSWFFIFSIAIV